MLMVHVRKNEDFPERGHVLYAQQIQIIGDKICTKQKNTLSGATSNSSSLRYGKKKELI